MSHTVVKQLEIFRPTRLCNTAQVIILLRANARFAFTPRDQVTIHSCHVIARQTVEVPVSGTKCSSIWPRIIYKTFQASVDLRPDLLPATNTPLISPHTKDLRPCLKTVIT